MKILVFAPFYPPHTGGVEFFSRDLHKELQKNRIEITVFTPRLPETAVMSEQSEEAAIVRFPAYEIIPNYPLPKYAPFFLTPSFFRMFIGFWKESPNIVISHTRFFNTSLLALAYAKIRKIPLVHIEHGASFVQSGNLFIIGIAKLYDWTLGRLVLKKATRVIAVSEEANQFVSALAPGIQCDVIHRGFDYDTIDAIPKSTSIQKNPGITRLLYIGRLVSGKGVHILLGALKNVKAQNLELIIIGDGPGKINLERMATEFPVGMIRFLGERSWEETIAILKTADIFINPSFTEGLPTTVAEAALCSKAIIATDVGGTRALFSEEAKSFLIPARDSEALTEKISLLLNDADLRETLGNTERHHMLENFSWQKSINRFLEIFEELMKKQ